MSSRHITRHDNFTPGPRASSPPVSLPADPPSVPPSGLKGTDEGGEGAAAGTALSSAAVPISDWCLRSRYWECTLPRGHTEPHEWKKRPMVLPQRVAKHLSGAALQDAMRRESPAPSLEDLGLDMERGPGIAALRLPPARPALDMSEWPSEWDLLPDEGE
jgi:hypothetical protein